MTRKDRRPGAGHSPPPPPSMPANGEAADTPDGTKTEGRAEESDAGEIGGPAGPEPTRYGDWEVGGRCTDF